MAEPLFVTFKVTHEGEQGHPMDHIIKRIEVDDAGNADADAVARLMESISRELARKASL